MESLFRFDEKLSARKAGDKKKGIGGGGERVGELPGVDCPAGTCLVCLGAKTSTQLDDF